MIFAALSGTFDQKFEIFFSNLSSVVNAVAGPRGDAALGVRFCVINFKMRFKT